MVFRRLIIIAAAACLIGSSPASASDSPGFSWTLPKTFLDLSLTYQYASCERTGEKDQVNMTINPILSARGIPDPVPGWRHEETGDLKTDWADVDITISTNPTTHVLSGVASHPTGEAAGAIQNVFSGIGGFAKIIGAVLGGGVFADTKLQGPKEEKKPKPCVNDPGAKFKALKIEVAQQQQTAGEKDSNSSDGKAATAKLQDLQRQLDQEKAKLSFTVKTTINPGYTVPDKLTLTADQYPPLEPEIFTKGGSNAKPTHTEHSPIKKADDPIAKIPQVDPHMFNPDIDWFDPAKMTLDGTELEVKLDFAHAIREGHFPEQDIQEQDVPDHPKMITYREPALIPVKVYQKRSGGDVLLLVALVPFAQYGSVEVIPLDTTGFKDGNWNVTFNELGEVTKWTYTGKSSVQKATSILSQVGTTANSVISEVRGANTAQATAIQGQADVIYQSHRLELCLRDPSNCPSK